MHRPRECVAEILARLEPRYGAAEWTPGRGAVDTLVACILSQHTSDVNSERAYDRLKDRFPNWDAVIEAEPEELADAIRCGGLANVKAPRIQAVLRQIRDEQGAVDLSCLDAMPDEEARSYLLQLPLVGPKTAAIVLCFGLGRPVLPVDTHVFRVSWRLGLIERRIGEARAHDALQAIVPTAWVYRFHIALIRHGRETCRAPIPHCSRCYLTDLCATFTDPATPKR